MNKLKTPEEYIKETFGWNHETSDLTHYVSYWKGLIKQAQIDAIQIAVEMCAEEASLIKDPDQDFRLTGDEYYDYIIDKQSILNVANKLKEELNGD